MLQDIFSGFQQKDSDYKEENNEKDSDIKDIVIVIDSSGSLNVGEAKAEASFSLTYM